MSPARRRRSRSGLAARILVVLAAFAIGIAVGASLGDDTAPGTTTIERTLSVVTLMPTEP